MKNVEKFDSAVRIELGIECIAAIIYNCTIATILSLYGVIIVAILIPLFLKTGVTKFCPIMKGLGVSTNK